MAARRTTKAIGSPLTKRLRELGCTFCPACFAFMFPDHVHVRSLALDLREARYVVVGGYGDARMVDTHADAAEAAELQEAA